MMVKSIDFRIGSLEENLENAKNLKWINLIMDLEARIDELNSLRDYVRNVMLWDTRPGRKKR